jgi:hypothetical protein
MSWARKRSSQCVDRFTVGDKSVDEYVGNAWAQAWLQQEWKGECCPSLQVSFFCEIEPASDCLTETVLVTEYFHLFKQIVFIIAKISNAKKGQTLTKW